MPSRIYVVTSDDGQTKAMVEAITPAQAIRHVAGSKYVAKPASPREVHDMVQAGVKLEKAGPEPAAAQAAAG